MGSTSWRRQTSVLFVSLKMKRTCMWNWTWCFVQLYCEDVSSQSVTLHVQWRAPIWTQICWRTLCLQQKKCVSWLFFAALSANGQEHAQWHFDLIHPRALLWTGNKCLCNSIVTLLFDSWQLPLSCGPVLVVRGSCNAKCWGWISGHCSCHTLVARKNKFATSRKLNGDGQTNKTTNGPGGLWPNALVDLSHYERQTGRVERFSAIIQSAHRRTFETHKKFTKQICTDNWMFPCYPVGEYQRGNGSQPSKRRSQVGGVSCLASTG